MRLLDVAYYGEVFFSRIQGIAFNNPNFNGEYRLIRALREEIRVAVDGGANAGDWTARVLRETAGRARILCIEPDPLNANYLRKRFVQNGNVVVKQAAISDRVGSTVFAQGQGHLSGSGHLAQEADGKVLRVDTITLESLSNQNGETAFDLVKCDIEGAEISALWGAENLFQKRRIGTCQLEYNATWLQAGRRLKEVFDFAHDLRYSVLAATPFGFARYPNYGIGLEDFRMRNMILAREDHMEILRPFGPSGRARVEAQSQF